VPETFRVDSETLQLAAGQPRDDAACVSPRVAADEEVVAGRDAERTGGGGDHSTPEEVAQPSAKAPAGLDLQDPAGKEPPQSGAGGFSMQVDAELQKELVGVGAPDDELNETERLFIGNPATAARVFAVAADLGVDDIGEPEAAREGERQVLVVQDLGRTVLIPQGLEQAERHLRVNAAGGSGGLPGGFGVDRHVDRDRGIGLGMGAGAPRLMSGGASRRAISAPAFGMRCRVVKGSVGCGIIALSIRKPMRRYAAYDPPEYQNWTPDAGLVRAWDERITADPERAAIVQALSTEGLRELYLDLLRTRLFDIGLKRWVRQGVISKAWLGTGEEAVTVGSIHGLDRERDLVCPMIRNAGACFMMGMPMADLFRGYLATPDSPNGGRDLHVGDLSRRVLQPISHMGTNVPVIAGVALAYRNRGEPSVALTWIGDGATKTGECHEGLNFAAVQKVPALFVLQDNRVALGTRAEEHGAGDLGRWGEIYGIRTWHADGNHVLDMYAATRLAAERCRAGEGPAMVVARTFRMGGHATHDEKEARETLPAELFREWGRRDPIGLFEAWLDGHGIGAEEREALEDVAIAEIDQAAAAALESRDLGVDLSHALYEGYSAGGVLAPLAERGVKASPRAGERGGPSS
jgi:TPP-dependent pyruvate/acetoin dehydrogenase alpha subunit